MYKAKTALALAHGEASVRAVSLYLQCINRAPTWRLLACTMCCELFEEREHCDGVTAGFCCPQSDQDTRHRHPNIFPRNQKCHHPCPWSTGCTATVSVTRKGFCMFVNSGAALNNLCKCACCAALLSLSSAIDDVVNHIISKAR